MGVSKTAVIKTIPVECRAVGRVAIKITCYGGVFTFIAMSF
jgi:hypothetical protein